MRLILAIDFDIEAIMLPAIIEQGHEILDRVTGSSALAESVTALQPQAVIVQASPETLTAASLSVCDRSGARTIAIYSDDYERNHAISLGIVDRADARDGWDAVEQVLARGSTARQGGAGPRHPQQGAPGDSCPPDTQAAGARAAQPTASEPPLSRRQRRAHQSTKPRKRRGSNSTAHSRSRMVSAQDSTSNTSAAGNTGQPTLLPSGSRPAGQVLAVWGPHGAPGRTTCAITLATEFANRGTRTVLLDADTYGGAIAQLLGVTDEAPGIAAACRLAAARSLDATQLDRIAGTVRCARGQLRVISGITNPARWPELSRERITGVIEQLRQWADCIVVDLGFNLESDEELISDVTAPRRNAATHTIIERADLVVAIGEATPVGLQRFLRGRQQLLPLLSDPARVHVVMNRVRRGMHGVDTTAQIGQVLRRFGGIEHAWMLPDDARACDRAITEAAALTEVAPRSALSKQYASLADRLLGELQRSPHPVT